MSAEHHAQRSNHRAEPVVVAPRANRRRLVSRVLLLTLGMTASIVGVVPAMSARARAATVTLDAFPVAGTCWYTDTWQAPRSGGRVHEGVDIGAAQGVPVIAALSGTITKVYVDQPNWKGGNALRLTAADGTYLFYGHLQSVADGIAAGAAVSAGQTIGFVGHTGNAQVDHLHFEVHPGGGAAVNPYPIVRAMTGCGHTGTPQTPTTQGPPTTSSTPSPTAALLRRNLGVAPPGTPGCATQYNIVAGDYWFLLTARFGVSAQALTAANGATLQTVIHPGDLLCVPSSSWVAPATTAPSGQPATTNPTSSGDGTASCSSRYEVQAGDYWFLLTSRFGVTSRALTAANGATLQTVIYPGQRLCIPSPTWVPPAAPTPAPTTTGQPPATTAPVVRPSPVPLNKCRDFYTVDAGDYWVMIAAWFQMRSATLAAANGMLITDTIVPGQILCVPYV